MVFERLGMQEEDHQLRTSWHQLLINEVNFGRSFGFYSLYNSECFGNGGKYECLLLKHLGDIKLMNATSFFLVLQ
jgi:hypothetical protein